MAYKLFPYLKGVAKKENDEINLNTDDLYLMLCTSFMEADNQNHEFVSDILLHEVAVNGSYPSGGILLPARSVDIYGGNVRISCGNTVFPALTVADMRYGLVFKPVGAPTGGFISDPAASPLFMGVDYLDTITLDGYDFPVLWNTLGLYRVPIIINTALAPVLSAANLSAVNITQGGFTLIYTGADSIVDATYPDAQILFMAMQGDVSLTANTLETAAGQTLFTAAQIMAGVDIDKTNAEGLVSVSLMAVSSNTGTGKPATINVAIPANQPPSIPTSLIEFNKSTTAVSVSFSPSIDPDGEDWVEAYELYLDTITTPPVPGTTTPFLVNSGGTAQVPPSTTFNCSGLTPGSTVYIYVVAKDNNGNRSALSARLDISIPANMIPTITPANIATTNASATTPGTINAVTAAIGSIGNVDGSPGGLTKIYLAYLTSAEKAGRVAVDNAGFAAWWATIPSNRKREYTSTLGGGGDDTAIASLVGSGLALTSLALLKDISYYQSAVAQEKRSDTQTTQWGSWHEATGALVYAAPTGTVQAPTNVVGESYHATNDADDGSLTANFTTASGLQRNVTRIKVIVGPSSVADGDPGNTNCHVQEYTGKNIASNTAATQAVTGLLDAAGSGGKLFEPDSDCKMWVQFGDEVAGYGAITPTPYAFTVPNVAPTVADADVLSLSSTSSTGYIATLQTSPAAFTDTEGYSLTYAIQRKLSTGSWDTPGDITTDATGLAIGDFPKTISGLTLAGGTYNVRTKCTDEQLAVTYSEVDSFVVIGYPHSFAGTSGDNPTSELFTTNETAAGVVQLNGSGQLVIATTADSDAGMVVPLANLTKTAGGGFKTKVKCNSWGAGFIIPLGLFQAANSPTYDSTTVMLDAAAGPTRALFRFLSATTMDVIYWNTSNAIKRWNRTGASTGSWVDSGNTPLTTSADTYYWVYLQPSTNGITFIVKDATDATVQMQTSEVAWTDIYGNGSANPYWAGFGDVLNNSSYGTQHWDDIDRA